MPKSLDPETQRSLVLALFVAPNNRARAATNLQQILSGYPENFAEVIEIDVTQVPEVAEIAGVIVTPMLVRYWPLPRINVVGDLSNHERVADAVLRDISAQQQQPTIVDEPCAAPNLLRDRRQVLHLLRVKGSSNIGGQ